MKLTTGVKWGLVAGLVVGVSAEPTVLVMNDINKVVVKIRDPGVVEGVITVSGGIVLG